MLKNISIIFLFRKLWKFAPARRKHILWTSVLQIITLLSDLIPPLVTAYILNLIQSEGLTTDNIFFILGLMLFNFVGIPVIGWGFWFPSRIMERKTAFLARLNFRDFLVNGVLQLGLNWHNQKKSGDIIDKINKASEELYNFSDKIMEFFQESIAVIGSIFILIYFDYRFTFLIIIYGIIVFFITRHYDKSLIPAYKKLSLQENLIQEKIFDNISNITTIKILNLEKITRETIFKFAKNPIDLDNRKNYHNEWKWFWADCFSYFFVFVIVGSYVWWNFEANLVIQIGTLTAIFTYLRDFSRSFFRLISLMNQWMIQKTRLQNVEEIEKDFSQIVNHKFRGKLPTNWQAIAIHDLNFNYEDSQHHQHAVKIKNLEIPRGQKVALLGESGAGKTTFLKLLRGLYKIKNGELVIDGQSRENNFLRVNNSSMLVPQDPEIFANTIKENIDMYAGLPQKKLEKFTDLAKFTKVLNRLPNQWNSVIGEKGVNLSGGEKQRLALARALLFCRDKDLILLDESTSSVDAKNEIEIYRGIFREFKEKTILASIHKLNLVPEFERIIVFEKGEIVLDGSYEELLKTSKKFQKIWEKYENSLKK